MVSVWEADEGVRLDLRMQGGFTLRPHVDAPFTSTPERTCQDMSTSGVRTFGPFAGARPDDVSSVETPNGALETFPGKAAVCRK